MKDQVEKFQNEVGRLMQERLANGRFEQIESLAPMLSKAGKLKVQINEIEMELASLENALAKIQNKNPATTVVPPSDSHEPHFADRGEAGRAEPSTTRIRINWRLNNREKDEEEIFSPIAANSLAAFIGRMISEFGNNAIQQLLKIKVNRGPLMSRSPEKDYGGYKSKRVPGTDLFVLTNNTTAEKVEIIKHICRELKLVPGSVIVETEGRFRLIRELLEN